MEEAVFPGGLRLTVSIGVAASDDPEQLGGLLELADRALYQAKRAGRNRVQAAKLPRPGRRQTESEAKASL